MWRSIARPRVAAGLSGVAGPRLASFRANQARRNADAASTRAGRASHAPRAAALAALGALGGALMAWPAEASAETEAARDDAAPPREPWWRHPLGWASRRPPPSPQALAIREDPRQAVVLALALPFVSVATGYSPSVADLAAAGEALGDRATALRPWEAAAILWGAARLGAEFEGKAFAGLRSSLLRGVGPPPGGQAKVAHGAAAGAASPPPPGDVPCLSAGELAMAAWALAAGGALDDATWRRLAGAAAARPEAERADDLVAAHLYQAALLWSQLGEGRGATKLAGVLVAGPPSLREDARDALVAAGWSPASALELQDSYLRLSSSPGFDGAVLSQLATLRVLTEAYGELGESPAYHTALRGLSPAEVEAAERLLSEPDLRGKLVSQAATTARGTSSPLGRATADVAATLRTLGLRAHTSVPAADGLVAADIVMPEYDLALFVLPPLRDPAPRLDAAALLGGAGSGAQGLAGYAASDAPGARRAKVALLRAAGWTALELRWDEARWDGARKRAEVAAALAEAPVPALVRGRVLSGLRDALSLAERSRLGWGRYEAASTGAYTHPSSSSRP